MSGFAALSRPAGRGGHGRPEAKEAFSLSKEKASFDAFAVAKVPGGAEKGRVRGRKREPCCLRGGHPAGRKGSFWGKKAVFCKQGCGTAPAGAVPQPCFLKKFPKGRQIKKSVCSGDPSRRGFPSCATCGCWAVPSATAHDFRHGRGTAWPRSH